MGFWLDNRACYMGSENTTYPLPCLTPSPNFLGFRDAKQYSETKSCGYLSALVQEHSWKGLQYISRKIKMPILHATKVTILCTTNE